MKVLIVDDNAANRMTLKWVLSKIDTLEIEEADSGFASITACEKSCFDLIFMDVMMPGMTGIEATIELKKITPKSMVIAVTALDDDETTKQMFKAGAEDYITKPIKQDIFKARLQTYLKIIENRHFYTLDDDPISLFKEPILNKLTIFKIRQEQNLAEFWENFLCGGNDFGNEILCDTVAKIYNIGTLLLKMDVQFSIFCEENEGNYFFTLNKTKYINKKVLGEIIRKDGFNGRFEISSDRLTISCEKYISLVEPSACTQTVIENAKALDINVSTSEVSEVYDFMNEQDLEDLEDYIKDLDSVLMLMRSSMLESGDVENISHKISKIASILSSYNETFELGTALRSLAFDISDNKDAFMASCSRLTTMFFSFTKDLIDWFTRVFKTGTPSIGFMDATIIANILMIVSTIKPQEPSETSALDDIFF